MQIKSQGYKNNKAVTETQEMDLIRLLRIKIMNNDFFPKVISITSSQAGEGKTTIALKLADSMVADGKKAIYIDGSLRKESKINQDTKVGSGLSDYLLDPVQSVDPLIGHPASGADLILNLHPVENSTELLGNDNFRKLLTELKLQYEYLIIDTPDMSSCIDAVVISKLADAAVHIVEFNRVSGEIIKEDINLLEETKTQVIGIVLNKIG